MWTELVWSELWAGRLDLWSNPPCIELFVEWKLKLEPVELTFGQAQCCRPPPHASSRGIFHRALNSLSVAVEPGSHPKTENEQALPRKPLLELFRGLLVMQSAALYSPAANYLAGLLLCATAPYRLPFWQDSSHAVRPTRAEVRKAFKEGGNGQFELVAAEGMRSEREAFSAFHWVSWGGGGHDGWLR